MEVVGDLHVEPEANGFPAWLLVRDSDDGRRAQIEYADYWYRNKFHGGPQNPHRAVVGVQDVTTTADGTTLLRLNYSSNFKDDAPAPRRALPAVSALHRLHHRPAGALPRTAGRGRRRAVPATCCATPEQAAAPQPLAEEGRLPLADRLGDTLGFTPSQRAGVPGHRPAAGDRRLGPARHRQDALPRGGHRRPGGGSRQAAGQPFRVLVTAFTHAAIENLLRKVRRPPPGAAACNTLGLAKAKYWQGAETRRRGRYRRRHCRLA